MRFQLLVFSVLILACTYPTLAQGSYGNCCLGHVKSLKKNVRKNVEGYRMQETDGDCNISAVVLQMKKRPGANKARTICANPEYDWVQHLMREVDTRRMT